MYSKLHFKLLETDTIQLIRKVFEQGQTNQNKGKLD